MEFELNGRLLKYENEEFYIWRDGGNWKNNPKWDLISICNCNGYKVINISKKSYKLHRIIAMLFLGLDINDTKKEIDHIDGNKNNNELSNLRVVNHQQNTFNFTKAKGYWYHQNKFRSAIHIDGKKIQLGCFDTEEEAKQAYLNAKLVYHKIII